MPPHLDAAAALADVAAAASASSPTVPTPILVTAVIALAGVVAYLFKLYDARATKESDAHIQAATAHAKEREEWAVERAHFEAEAENADDRLRAEYEAKFRELIVRYDEVVSRERAANRTHEDAVRKEFAEIMEGVADKAAAGSAALSVTIDKIYERFIAPRVRR